VWSMATSEGELWPPGHTGRKTRTLPVHRRWRRRRWVGRAAGAEIGRGRHADTTNPASGAEFTVRSGCSSLRHCRWRVEPTRVADKHSVQLRAQERVHHLRCSPVGDGGGGHKDLGACDGKTGLWAITGDPWIYAGAGQKWEAQELILSAGLGHAIIGVVAGDGDEVTRRHRGRSRGTTANLPGSQSGWRRGSSYVHRVCSGGGRGEGSRRRPRAG
jgi:hypothetical protein